MRIAILFMLMITIAISIFGISIYDIQYTTVAGNGTYPSLLVGQTVTTQGIVTGVGFTGNKYVISEASGAWKGIFINDTFYATHNPQLGDKIEVTGSVAEVSGVTEINITTATGYTLINSGNDIPAAISVTPGDLQYNTGYSYDGVLVKLTNVTVTSTPFGGQFPVTDNVSSCSVNSGFFDQPYSWNNIVSGQTWAEINGIVCRTSGQYKVNPRNDEDLVPPEDVEHITVKIGEAEAALGATKSVNIYVSKIKESYNITKYVLKVGYNKGILRFVDADLSDLTTSMPSLTVSPQEDEVTLTYQATSPIISPNNDGILVKLSFKTQAYGESVLELKQVVFNDTIPASILTNGKIVISIQKKIAWLNIYNGDSNNNFVNKKNIFNPWLDQKIVIEYGSKVQSGGNYYKSIIRIYDAQGRLVATPVNRNMDNANSFGIIKYLWDGRDRNRNLLPIGIYYCHFEIIDRLTGSSEVTTQPIVIASDLK